MILKKYFYIFYKKFIFFIKIINNFFDNHFHVQAFEICITHRTLVSHALTSLSTIELWLKYHFYTFLYKNWKKTCTRHVFYYFRFPPENYKKSQIFYISGGKYALENQ